MKARTPDIQIRPVYIAILLTKADIRPSTPQSDRDDAFCCFEQMLHRFRHNQLSNHHHPHAPGGIAAQMTKQTGILYTNMQNVELMLVKTHVENQVS